MLLEGDYLLGDDKFVLEPGAARPYLLIYSPLVPKTHVGSITFLSPKVCERATYDQAAEAAAGVTARVRVRVRALGLG